MSFNFENLDQRTRVLMEDEVNYDIRNNRLYISLRLTEVGKVNYSRLLKEAIVDGNEVSFCNDLKNQNCIKAREERRTKNGIQLVNVPATANETLAEGEFNRFYIRALCRRVLEDKTGILEIYRAKQVLNPRPESQMIIGKTLDPERLLNDLRINIGIDPALGLPQGPNSGLSIRLLIRR